jgi:hypothetical protein
MRGNRIIPVSLKHKIILEVLTGSLTKEEARRVYNLKGKSGILEWMRKFGLADPIPKFKILKDDSKQEKVLRKKIAELEKQLKFQKLKSRAYQIMVEIAKEDHNLDLEKKRGAKQSKDLKKKKIR